MGKHQRNGVERQQELQSTSQRIGAHAESAMTRPPCLSLCTCAPFYWAIDRAGPARSTPFLCSCAKKRGGAPKKRAFGGRRNLITTVTPARQTTRAKRSSPVPFAPGEGYRSDNRQAPSPSRARNVPPTDWQRSREWWSHRGKKAPFFGGSTPFLWASTKEMGSKGSRSYNPPPNVSAHTQKVQ